MTVNVLLFASYADAAGRSSITVDVGASGTVADVVSAVRAANPGAALPPAPAVAVNQRYARYSDAVRAGDEIAIIPPVAGG